MAPLVDRQATADASALWTAGSPRDASVHRHPAHPPARAAVVHRYADLADPEAGASKGLGWEALTPRELEVVGLVTLGATNQQTARRLRLSPHTVNAHLRHVFTKLGVCSRVELTRIALAQENAAR